MARTAQRRVKRQPATGKQAIVRSYNTRAWYQLPDWAASFVVDAIPWVTGFFAVLLAPAAALALVLGFHALPLEFFGVPASANDIGLAAVVLFLKFVFLALAVRPLYRRQLRGWAYLLIAVAVHLGHSAILQHAITGSTLFLLAFYLYFQVRRYYS